MNKDKFKVVFNKLRGLMVVIAERAHGHQHANSTSSLTSPAPGSILVTLRPIACFMLLAGGQLMALNQALADIIADPSAPANQRPVIMETANGLPLVNIQTPSAAGVSRNTYRQFDVQQTGAILNNSHSNVQTQLGGWVSGNPYLAGGTARVILNEVNSSNPSLLNGFIEIAGSRAQLVIANPAGISCDGCGFINANRTTLTTGTPIVNGGNLLGYRVGGGSVSFLGAGMDASQINYTDIIARAVEINAGLWANALSVITGSNQISTDGSGRQTAITAITPIAADPGSAAPAFAVDVATLGGMYAGKIHMIGTEAGLGVRNAGSLGAGAGEVMLTADGQILNYGAIYGDHIAIAASTLINDGETTAGITGGGVIAAHARLDIGATSIENRNNGLMFSAGDLAVGGNLDTDQHASGSADTLINEGATMEALGSATLAATDLQNRNAGLETELVVDSTQRILEVQPEGWPRRYDISHFPSINNHNIERQPFLDDNGHFAGDFEDYTYYDYTATTRSTHVISSQPGRIIAGSDMALLGNVTNSDSQILAGGNLDISGAVLENLATAGQQVISYSGQQQFRDWDGNDEELEFGPWVPYSPANKATTIDLAISQLADNTTPSGSASSAIDSLFHSVPDMSADYLIETDPRFANYRSWLGSDYMLAQLSFDPATTQQRLGDGFYEQRLVREQIAELTGRRFLDGYTNDETQYQALMDAGLTVANALQLIPGVALTAEQLAQLTSDIVWLVEQDVTLPDGTVTQALVPKVYVRPQADDLHPTTGLLAGNTVNIQLSGDATNSGTIAGRQLVTLDADNIRNLGGQINADVISAQAAHDIDIQGGTLAARDILALQAGNDITVASATVDAENRIGNSRFTRTNIDRVAGLYVTGENGILVASAGNDVNLLAAQIVNTGQNGTTVIDAANDLRLGTVNVAEQNDSIHSAKIFNRSGNTQEIGTIIQTQGDIALNTGHDLTARAATVSTESGDLNINAGNNINVENGTATYNSDIGWATKRSGTLSSRKKEQRDSFNEQTSVSSSLSGDSVSLQAGQNIAITGSNIVSDNSTTLNAGGNIAITAAEQTFEETHYQKTKRSGISTSGASVSIGSQQLMTNTDSTRTAQSGSTVGSVAGDVAITAGETYTQQASDVLAPAGNINITAQQVNIEAAQNTGKTVQETKFKQSGITLAISNPVINTVQTAEQMKQAAANTSDSRMQALAAGTTALAAKNAYDQIQAAQSTATTGNVNDTVNQVGGVNLSISIGSSKSSSTSTQTSSAAQGSKVMAGGDIVVTATGAGGQSDINIIGSQVKAGGDVNLKAEDQINLIAAKNTETLNSKNKSSSASIGVSIGTTSGLTVTGSASRGKGKASGNDVTWAETIVEAGKQVTLESGMGTNIIGAQVKGKQVVADVGTSGEGNLNIQSLQDTSTYDSKQKSAGISISVPIGAGAYGGSINASNSKINSDYASVNEQAGIFAGDEGFQIDVAGNTNLTGAVIASTEQAIQDNKNSLTTETLTVSNIQNKAEYKAKGASATIGGGLQAGLPQLSGAGVGSDSGDAESVTVSAISGGEIDITDDAGQQAKSGRDASMTVALLNRDVHVNEQGDAVDSQANSTSNTITPIFDAEKVQKEINAQVAITQSFGQQASKAVGDYVQKQKQILREAYKSAPEAERAAIQIQFDDLILQERVMNVLIGAVTGLAGSALAQETLSLAADEMHRISVENSMRSPGFVDAYGNVITNLRPGEEDKLRQDIDLAGTRLDPDGICGKAYERCKVQRDENNNPVLDANGKPQLAYNADGRIQFTYRPEGQELSIYDFLATDEGKKMYGITGGIQGGVATFAGYTYPADGVIDQVFKAFGGTHDFIGGQVPGLYDDQGNIKQGMTEAERTAHNTWSTVAIIPSAPFAMAELLPPEVWKAISILLGAAK